MYIYLDLKKNQVIKMKNAQNIPMKQMFWENVLNLLDVIMNNDNMGSFVLYLLH